MKVELNGKEYHYDGYLKKNLDIYKAMPPRDFDVVGIIDGMEGAGKSVLAQQVGKFFYPDLKMKDICFNAKEFEDACIHNPKESCVIYDEAYGGLSARDSMTKVNKALVKMLAEIRQKRLFVLMVLPTFFDLDRYVALWRSRFLIHVYTKEGYKRGNFTFFNAGRKKTLYMLGKKTYNYGMTKANFFGNFTNTYMVNETAYRAKKLEALKAYQQDKLVKPTTKDYKEEFKYASHLLKKCGMPGNRQAKEYEKANLNVPVRTINGYILDVERNWLGGEQHII